MNTVPLKLFLCSQADFTVLLLVAHRLTESPSLEGIALVLGMSELLYVCGAAGLHIVQ